MSVSVLGRFRPEVATWFQEVFAEPTEVQTQAWKAISDGDHALVVAPTGSGKTLAAFLWALNSLVAAPGQAVLPGVDTPGSTAGGARGTGGGVKVLYISPLKALGVDVENNLRVPLTGIARTAERLGADIPHVSVSVRSGDTPSAERARLLRNPPDILITTPESLYLMLTSKAAGILRGVETVIVDEIHALAGTKRGVHLAVSLERLEQVTAAPVQRIGLSATVRPLPEVARYLGGTRPVEIIAPPAPKRWQLTVRVPVEDMSDLPVAEPGSTIGEAVVDDPLGLSTPLEDPADPASGGGMGAMRAMREAPEESALPTQASIWRYIEQSVYQEIMGARSTLVFVNSRRTAERLTSRINELYAKEFHPESLSAPLRRDPAQLMKSTDTAGEAAPLIARAHHGSVSKDERATTETMLKSGALKCVVATSSLELGIDMGAVDLVIQVESTPSVASGLQRVGRAGHTVGAVSVGSFYPKHRADLVQTAVTVERMREGKIEALTVPTNALDVLAQQTVAAVAAEQAVPPAAAPGRGGGLPDPEPLTADAWFDVVRRAYPYRDLSRDVFDAVIDLVSGTYPATDFAELKPRVVFDRVTGQLTPRPGAQRVAVTNGGTIPDRGMFGVFLAGGDGAPRRVGELDEEMVYESRVGDVFTLGASSWRISEINRDQVLVTPAPGHTGRLPFWTGDQAGRPAELGKALGAFRREVSADADRLEGLGLDEFAAQNLVAFLEEQEEATGVVPDERTLVLERFTDELGDWRVVLHTPYGRGVNAAWALAVGARVSERTGMDAQAVAGDDGIVLRLPQGESEPSAELFAFEADEIADLVTAEVGGSALFASRFRECAARALLLPRRNPGKRAPLWQQRQRAAQLLDVAKQYPSFPIILETVRECLHDVYDIPALEDVCRDLAARRIRIAEVITEQPSPFASSLLFNYTGVFMYEGDSPLAEKRAAALALDPALLAKLLGTVELKDLLDPEVLAETHAQLQHTAPGRKARSPEELVDVLRVVGPIPTEEVPEHCEAFTAAAAERALGVRVMRVRIAGVEHLALTQDAALLRDALGIPVPPGVAAQAEPITDALQQLVGRWSRARGPFTLDDCATAFGLGIAAVHSLVQAECSRGRIVEGRYTQGVAETEYCAKDVLRIIRTRSLAVARAQAQPVSQSAFARFGLDWQQIAAVGERPKGSGPDGVFAAIEQLAGVRLPASAWESLVLPARVAGYNPAWLDELTAAGDVFILGCGSAGSRDPWLMVLPADYAAELAPPADREGLSGTQEDILRVLDSGGGYLYPELARELDGAAGEGLDLQISDGSGAQPERYRDALWGLVERGLVAPDGFAPIRARLAGVGARTGGGAAHRARRRPNRGRLRMGRTSFAHARPASTAPDLVGRWSSAVLPADDATHRSVAHGEAWLDRYGVVTRGSVVAEDVLGGFQLTYKVLSGFEESGKAMRGYFIEGLGAAQFSTRAVIDRLRSHADSPDVSGWPSGGAPKVAVLAACDPANPYGGALPWPESPARLARAAGSVVVLIDGLLAAHLGRGGRSLALPLDAWPDGVWQQTAKEDVVGMVVRGLSEAVGRRWLQPVVIETIDGDPVWDSPWVQVMRAAGASITPKGVKFRGAAAGERAEGPTGSAGPDPTRDPASGLNRGGRQDPPLRKFRGGGFARR